MNTSKHTRAAGAMAHLLLVVVLALGVFVMHTVGHPDDSAASSGAGMAAGAHGPVAGTHTAPGPDHAAMTAAASSPALGAASAEHEHGQKHEHATATVDQHGTGMGMDMASLCVAVLVGAWALAALRYAAFIRRSGWLAKLLARSVVLLRPNPPPRIPVLAQSSVLRI
ncbi:DUF6153 family protein [Streptomyces sp. NPDC002851]